MNKLCRDNDYAFLNIFAKKIKINNRIVKYNDPIIFDMYDHNYYEYKSPLSAKDINNLYDIQKQNNVYYLSIKGPVSLDSKVIEETSLSQGNIIAMLFKGNTKNWKTNKDVVIHDVKLEELNKIELKHYANSCGKGFILRRNKTLIEYTNDNFKYIGAYIKNKLVASVYYFNDGKSVCFDGLLVDESYRHKYIATTLIKYIIEHNNLPVYLHAERSDTPKDMYLKMGFEIVDEFFEYFKIVRLVDVEKELLKVQDKKYKEFSIKLSPSADASTIVGVRIPELRKIAKKIIDANMADEYLNAFPHKYHEEFHIHNYLVNEINDYDKAINEVNKILPYFNDWSLTDELKPKAFNKNKDKLIKEVKKWLNSKKEFIVRYAIIVLMKYYLEDDFKEEYYDLIIKANIDKYYIRIASAWYFAEALLKQYDSAIKVIENKKLDKWTHNKAIQKAIESFRISDETKEYLKNLRIK